MEGKISGLLLRLVAKKEVRPDPSPLLIELLEHPPTNSRPSYGHFPFSYYLHRVGEGWNYSLACDLPVESEIELRKIVQRVSDGFDPLSVEPLAFSRLIEVLTQEAARFLGGSEDNTKVNELGELVAYEAIGLSRILAIAKDRFVTEFYVDSDRSPIYLDHLKVGRCETGIMLTDRERCALQTHMDTFRGYTPDYATPSLKNDLEVAGARLRISLDLEPVSVNRFALDVRRLDAVEFNLRELVSMDVISSEAAAFLVVWLERGGNVTIIGETGTGKTTLLNALDEQVNPRLRRVYIEDAVETRSLLEKGYHQLKIKVDPIDRGRTIHSKESEIVKVLHRSPDIVVLSEIQSEEHSRAFFHSLSAGIRGMQTFHSTSIEQAIRRWTTVHGIPRLGLLDLGVMVQMSRPDRLGPSRIVTRICVMVSENGDPRVREVYARDRGSKLVRVLEWSRINTPGDEDSNEFASKVEGRNRVLEAMTVRAS